MPPKRSTYPQDWGFSLIELLVVMTIVGILAAVAIPVFLNQRAAAYDTSVRSDVREVARTMESYFVNETAYPEDLGELAAVMVTAELSPFTEVVLVEAFTDRDAYCLEGSTERSPRTFHYDSDGGGLLAPGVPCT